MAEAVNAPRPGVRAARTAATRRRMVDAAYALFCERGYDATKMTDIASRAAVSVQTLYFTFGTKQQLLHEAFVAAVLGDPALPPDQQPWFAAMRRARTTRGGLAAIIDGAVDIFERVLPLVGAVRATAGTEAGEVWTGQQRMRRQAFRGLLMMLAEIEPLRAGVSLERATDTMLVILGPDVFRLHTVDNGWTSQQYATWATDALHRLLFTAHSA